jgi:hypothetical protein
LAHHWKYDRSDAAVRAMVAREYRRVPMKARYRRSRMRSMSPGPSAPPRPDQSANRSMSDEYARTEAGDRPPTDRRKASISQAT